MRLITTELLQATLSQARRSPRRRMNFNFHTTPEDNAHRFLNVMLRGTYITPHRHVTPPKAETFLVLAGRIAFFLFDDAGAITECCVLGQGSGAIGADIPAGAWHTMAVLSDHAVCFEVKAGPYAPAKDKEFAAWAPREGEPGCAAYLEALLTGLETGVV